MINNKMKQIVLIFILTFLTTIKVIACDYPLRLDIKQNFRASIDRVMVSKNFTNKSIFFKVNNE